MAKVKWEALEGSAFQFRARIHSGWLYKEMDSNGRFAICFVPDPMHTGFPDKPVLDRSSDTKCVTVQSDDVPAVKKPKARKAVK